jgi:putative PIN family toxin of toxin-antitoxin system
MRLVLDTDVMLSALRSPRGASRLLVLAAWEGAVVSLASVAMILEYEAVLKRPEHLAAMGLTAGDVDAFLDHWSGLVEPVAAHFSWRPTLRDANDEIFVQAAVNGAADMIVTFNLSDYRPADDRQSSLGIEVGRPGDVLRKMKWRPSATTLSAFRLR